MGAYTGGIALGDSVRQHTSVLENPPPLDGVQLTVVNSASKASVLQLELSSLLQKGAIEEIPQSDIERGFFSRRGTAAWDLFWIYGVWIFPSTKGSSRCWQWNHHVSNPRRGLVCHYRPKGCIFLHPGRSATQKVPSFCLSEGRLTNTRSFRSGWPWRREHSRNAWMLHWPLWGSRAFVCWTTWTTGSFWLTPGS